MMRKQCDAYKLSELCLIDKTFLKKKNKNLKMQKNSKKNLSVIFCNFLAKNVLILKKLARETLLCKIKFFVVWRKNFLYKTYLIARITRLRLH